jgi:energy-coupling factor transporter transmembrane protein EcfT
MKIGPFDGTTEEVKDLIENNGLNIEDFLERPQPPLKNIFIAIPSIFFLVFIILLALLSNTSHTYPIKVIWIFIFSSGTWVCVSTQIRYKNGVATFCVAIGALIIALFSAGILSPKEATEFVRGLKPSK